MNFNNIILININSNSCCSSNKSIICYKLIEIIYISLIVSENERYSIENIIITYFIKYQFIYWNMKSVISLMYENQL